MQFRFHARLFLGPMSLVSPGDYIVIPIDFPGIPCDDTLLTAIQAQITLDT